MMNTIKKLLFLSLCVCVCLGVSSGCGKNPLESTIEDPVEPPIEEPAEGTKNILQGTKWKFIGFVDVETGKIKKAEPDKSRCFRLGFNMDNTVDGIAVSNEINGNFKIDSATSRINIDANIITYRFEMYDEDLYVKTLKDACYFSMQDGELRLYYNSKMNYLLFNDANTYKGDEETKVDYGELILGKWILVKCVTEAGDLKEPGYSKTIEFLPDGGFLLLPNINYPIYNEIETYKIDSLHILYYNTESIEPLSSSSYIIYDENRMLKEKPLLLWIENIYNPDRIISYIYKRIYERKKGE